MTTNIAIISNKQHRLYQTLKDTSIALRQIKVVFFDLEDNIEDFKKFDIIFDFTVQQTTDKIIFINTLTTKIISDLTFNNGDVIKEQCSNLIAAFATGIYSPKNCYEMSILDNSYEQVIDSIFCELDIELLEAQNCGIGFIFPRTIVQIINEAYYALAEGLASAEDIDNAMKSGVNYPLGPIEWAKKSGLKNVYQLLNELYKDTGQDRYRPCPHLLT